MSPLLQRNNKESRANNQENTKYKTLDTLSPSEEGRSVSLRFTKIPFVIRAKAGIHYKLLDPVFQREGDWGFCHLFYAPLSVLLFRCKSAEIKVPSAFSHSGEKELT